MASGLEALLTQELFITLANPTITTWANPFPQPVVHEIVKVVVVDRHSVFYQTAMLGLVLLILGKLAEKREPPNGSLWHKDGSSPTIEPVERTPTAEEYFAREDSQLVKRESVKVPLSAVTEWDLCSMTSSASSAGEVAPASRRASNESEPASTPPLPPTSPMPTGGSIPVIPTSPPTPPMRAKRPKPSAESKPALVLPQDLQSATRDKEAAPAPPPSAPAPPPRAAAPPLQKKPTLAELLESEAAEAAAVEARAAEAKEKAAAKAATSPPAAGTKSHSGLGGWKAASAAASAASLPWLRRSNSSSSSATSGSAGTSRGFTPGMNANAFKTDDSKQLKALLAKKQDSTKNMDWSLDTPALLTEQLVRGNNNADEESSSEGESSPKGPPERIETLEELSARVALRRISRDRRSSHDSDASDGSIDAPATAMSWMRETERLVVEHEEMEDNMVPLASRIVRGAPSPEPDSPKQEAALTPDRIAAAERLVGTYNTSTSPASSPPRLSSEGKLSPNGKSKKDKDNLHDEIHRMHGFLKEDRYTRQASAPASADLAAEIMAEGVRQVEAEEEMELSTDTLTRSQSAPILPAVHPKIERIRAERSGARLIRLASAFAPAPSLSVGLSSPEKSEQKKDMLASWARDEPEYAIDGRHAFDASQPKRKMSRSRSIVASMRRTLTPMRSARKLQKTTSSPMLSPAEPSSSNPFVFTTTNTTSEKKASSRAWAPLKAVGRMMGMRALSKRGEQQQRASPTPGGLNV